MTIPLKTAVKVPAVSDTMYVKKDTAIPVTGRGGSLIFYTISSPIVVSDLNAGRPSIQEDSWYSFLL
jgi:hypothetical protein